MCVVDLLLKTASAHCAAYQMLGATFSEIVHTLEISVLALPGKMLAPRPCLWLMCEDQGYLIRSSLRCDFRVFYRARLVCRAC